MRIRLIAAVSGNDMVIGNQGDIPWHIPAEFRHFKKTTKGNAVVMGRLTWESLPIRPLPDRYNMVISRTQDAIEVGASVSTTLEGAANMADFMGYKTLDVIGGAQIYKHSLPIADELIISRIHNDYEGDTFFPLNWYEMHEFFKLKKLDKHNGFDVAYFKRRK